GRPPACPCVLEYGPANFPSVAFLSGSLGNDPRSPGRSRGWASPGGPVKRPEVTTPPGRARRAHWPLRPPGVPGPARAPPPPPGPGPIGTQRWSIAAPWVHAPTPLRHGRPRAWTAAPA
ncbi:unnamed protein product, partial [Ixodes persulcatus]